MSLARWKSFIYKLRSLLGFFGTYIIFSVISTLISFAVLFVIFVNPNDPDLGRTAAAAIAFVLSPIIGMTLALVVMYFFERGFQGRDL
jgi:putative flippase GtrA